MISNIDELMSLLDEKLREILRTKEFGTFGISITMHDGLPLKITELNETNFLRRPGNRVVISK